MGEPATDNELWYAHGLSFQCAQCGRCCAGPGEGYVWVSEEEVSAIADHLGMPRQQLVDRYVWRANGRFSLRERDDNHDCVFLVTDRDGGRVCAVYQVRPTQCRTWPFWRSNLRSPEAWCRAGQKCPGVNQGESFSIQEIQVRRDAANV